MAHCVDCRRARWLAFAWLALGLLPPAARPATADLVLLHGRVITMDPADRVVEALAVAGGRIVATGTDAQVRQLAGPSTRIVDLHGRAATPGLIDAHAHVLSQGLTDLFEIGLDDATRIDDIAARVATRVATAKPGEWIVGSGWDESKLAGHRYPVAADIDRVSPANPVWLVNSTGHFGVANSAALKLAGIGAATSAPAAGVIERDAGGRPDGILKEAAMDAVLRILPSYSIDQRRQAIEHMLRVAHTEGLTGFKDPDIDADDWAAYRGAAADGRLDEQVCVLFHTPTTLDGARGTLAAIRAAQRDVAALRDPSLGVCGAKIYMDGSGVGRTAWMYQDWNRNYTDVDAGNRGFPALDPAVYRSQVALFVAAGVSVGTHAVGDRAIDWVADTYAATLRANPQRGLRLAIIHANIPTDHAIDVFADLQRRYDSGIPETQAGFLWWLGDAYPASLGATRSQRMVPLRTYLDRGIIWAGGSDAGVTPLAPRFGLWASVERRSFGGTYGPTPFGTAQGVDVHAALRSYTIWAARQLFADGRTGSLERGKSADIVVWDRDPYTVPPAQLRDMACDMTLFRGRIVFERPD